MTNRRIVIVITIDERKGKDEDEKTRDGLFEIVSNPLLPYRYLYQVTCLL
jgi:hypothetical protein